MPPHTDDNSAPALQIHTACHRTVIPAGEQTQSAYLLAEIEARPDLPRTPLNLALVIDRSGAVVAECLPGLKQALRDLIGQLTPQDALSLTSISGQVILPMQLVENKTLILRQIELITAGDEPRTCAGLNAAMAQAQSFYDPQRLSRLILIVGGEMSEAPQCFHAAANLAGEQHMPIIAIGIGSAWSETLLIEIVDRSLGLPPGSMGGLVEHIPTPDDLAMIANELFTMLYMTAYSAELRLLLARGLEVRNVWQVRPMIKNLNQRLVRGSTLQLPIDSLVLNGNTYLIEVSVAPRAAGPARIMQIELTAQLPELGPQKVVADLVVTFSPDTGSTNPLNTHVMDFVESTQAYQLNLQALAELAAGNRQAASQKLRQAAAVLISQGRSALADRIRGEADYNIRQYGQVSSEGRKLILLASQRSVCGE